MTRQARNAKMLLTVDPICREKFIAVLHDLEKHGWQPVINEALRTRAQQAAKVRKGYSKTMNSYHVPRKGWGGSRACDITDIRYAWNSPRKFWMQLCSSGLAHGLSSGLFFGLNMAQKGALLRDIKAKKWDSPVKFGWDGAHLQMENK